MYLRGALSAFEDRLHYGAKKDIIPLLRIPGVLPFRARWLHRNGFRTVESIAFGPRLQEEGEGGGRSELEDKLIRDMGTYGDKAAKAQEAARVARRIEAEARNLVAQERPP
jgi:replicative superfamily II helicase